MAQFFIVRPVFAWVIALFIMVAGALLFIPAANLISFPLFLAAIFVAAIGALNLCRSVLEAARAVQRKLRMDELTFAGAFVLAVACPLAVLFMSFALDTARQYASAADTFGAASEFLSLRGALSAAGGNFAYVPSVVSQYPVYEKSFGLAMPSLR